MTSNAAPRPTLTSEPALQALMVGAADALVPPQIEGHTHGFAIPAGTEGVWLLSRSFIPNAVLGTADRRRLGVAVQRLVLDGRAMRLDDAALTDGWHGAEADFRWTNGCAWIALPPASERLEVTLHPGCPGSYTLAETGGAAMHAPLVEYRPAIETTMARATNQSAAQHLLALPIAAAPGGQAPGVSLPLDRRDGGIVVTMPDGKQHVVTREGSADLKLAAAWSVEGVFAGSASFYVLALVREDGERAAWYLNARFEYVGNTPAALQDAYRASLRAAILGYVGAVWQGLVCAPRPIFDPAGWMLSGMESGLRSALIREESPDPSFAATEVVLEALDDLLATEQEAGSLRRLHSSGSIRQIFQRDCSEFLTDALRGGRIVLASPFGGAPQEVQGGLILGSFTIAYRFADAAAGHAFYAVTSLWRCDLVALYFPELRVAIFRDDWSRRMLNQSLGQTLQPAILSHCAEHAPALAAYLAHPDKQLVAMLYQPHLGHHLWNELTGLDALVRDLPAKKLPPVYVLNAIETEMYGPIDALFPALRGRVDRSLDNYDALACHAYANALCPLRLTSNFISRGLATQIIAHNESDPTLAPDRVRHVALLQARYHLVLLGLRVENRTLADQEAFFADVMTMCVEELGRVAFVIDGHNMRDGVAFRSHGEQASDTVAIAEERRIVELFAYRFRGDASVQVVDIIGAPLRASIFWCNRAAFFVTPWGAGLAKYRWVCNRPGIVVAGRRFLQRAGATTIHLYDAPRNMGAPTRMLINTPDAAEDEPERSALVPVTDANRVNFRVDRDAVRLMVRQLAHAVRR